MLHLIHRRTAVTTNLFAVFVTKRVQTWCDKYCKYSFINGFYSFIFFIIFTLQK